MAVLFVVVWRLWLLSIVMTSAHKSHTMKMADANQSKTKLSPLSLRFLKKETIHKTRAFKNELADRLEHNMLEDQSLGHAKGVESSRSSFIHDVTNSGYTNTNAVIHKTTRNRKEGIRGEEKSSKRDQLFISLLSHGNATPAKPTETSKGRMNPKSQKPKADAVGRELLTNGLIINTSERPKHIPKDPSTFLLTNTTASDKLKDNLNSYQPTMTNIPRGVTGQDKDTRKHNNTRPVIFPDNNEKTERLPFHSLHQLETENFPCAKCVCSGRQGNHSVDCFKANLFSIPSTLPGDVWSIRMTSNKIYSFQLSQIFRYLSLYVLDLSHNQIGKIVFGTEKHHQLTSLNLTHNNLCQSVNLIFKNLPSLKTLSLSHNKIFFIPPYVFEECYHLTHLDLSWNALLNIEPTSFDSLINLRVLSLSHNKGLGYTNDFFTSRLFKKLNSLDRLDLQGSSNGDVRYPDEALRGLVNLETLLIDGLEDGIEFGKEMRNLVRLKTLRISPDSECYIQRISWTFLENVTPLTTFSLGNCPLIKFNPYALKNQTILSSFSINKPGNYSLDTLISGLRLFPRTRLRHVALTGFRPQGIPCQEISSYNGILSLSQLEELDLSDNFLVDLNQHFLNSTPALLKILRLNNNRMTLTAPIWDRLSNLKSLELLDIGYQNARRTGSRLLNREINSGGHDPYIISKGAEHMSCSSQSSSNLLVSSSVCRQGYDAEREEDVRHKDDAESNSSDVLFSHHLVTLPPNLKVIKSSNYLYNGETFFFSSVDTTSLKEIDFERNFLTDFGQGRIPQSVEIANLRDNYCTYISMDFIPIESNLMFLFISKNSLGPFIATDSLGETFFHARKLRYLDLAENLIFHIPFPFFRKLESLETLVLAKNNLQFIDINFSDTPSLTFLDLSWNAITWISEKSRQSLNEIASRHVLKIDLTENALPCSCEGIELLLWMKSTKVTFHNQYLLECSSPDNNRKREPMGSIETRLRHLQAQCSSSYITIVTAFLSVPFCIFIGVALLYKNRWKLIYARNVWLGKMYGFQPMGGAVSGRVFDAYVVYSQEDRRFALDVLLHELEDKRGHKLCVEDRDFLPGSFNFNNITCAVKNSNVTLLVMSPDFLQDGELEYATNMALMDEYSGKTHRDVLLLLNYKKTRAKHMSKDLLLLMKKGRFLDYPLVDLEEEDGEEEEVPDSTVTAFWDRLSREIGHTENNSEPPLIGRD